VVALTIPGQGSTAKTLLLLDSQHFPHQSSARSRAALLEANNAVFITLTSSRLLLVQD
jgi:hypothetical protein